jgi:two-component system, OmpR family, sensor histidine kinase KdpD
MQERSAYGFDGDAEQLRRSDAVKTTLLRAVSHDFRSPLTAIVTAAGALVHSDLVLDDGDRRDLAETILTETLRLDRLVGDLLDLSRLEAGAVTSVGAAWPIEDVVLQAVEGVREGVGRLDLSLDEAATVQVDPHQLERVLVNLIENALRYSRERVSVQTRRMRSEVLVRVVDSGPGIHADELDRIFEPFRRGAKSGDTRGSGLGLAIARGFAEANGGRLWAESFPGQGAVFVLALPLAACQVGCARAQGTR